MKLEKERSAMISMVLSVLQAEFMKYKRSALLPLTVATPLSLVMMQIALFLYLRSGYVARSAWNWDGWMERNLYQWCTLFLPAFITLITTIPAAIEASSWKFVLVQPPSRTTIYSCKLLMTCCYLLLATFVLMITSILAGVVIQLPGSFALGQLLPFLGTILAILPAVVLQHWIAIRTTDFLVPLGVGAAGVYLTFISSGRTLGYFVVWAFPVVTLLTRKDIQPPFEAQSAFLFVVLPLGVLLCIIGAIDFAHKEFTT